MSADVLNFEVMLTTDDLVAFVEDYADANHARRTRWIQSAWASLLAGLLVGLVIGLDNPTSGVVVGAAIAVVMFVAMPSVQRDRFKKVIRQKYDNDKQTATFVGLHRYSIGPEGIRSTTEHTDAVYNWPSVHQIRCNQGHLFVYVGPGSALVIPTTALRGASKDQILESIAHHVPEIAIVENEA